MEPSPPGIAGHPPCWPEFSVQRLVLPFLEGFSSARCLPEAAPALPGGSSRTSALVRFVESARAARGGLLGYDAVHVDGGDLGDLDLDLVSRACGIPVYQGTGGRFAGEAGGLAILEENGLHGMVCDLGQTGLKISWAGLRRTFARDRLVLPEKAGGEPVSVKGAQRRALRKFLGDSIRSITDEAGAGLPQALVCALPSSIDRWGQPRGSSYIGMRDDTQLVPDALETAGWPSGQIILLNDAELAAVSALEDERVQEHLLVLVVTLGYAIGAASLDLLKQATGSATGQPESASEMEPACPAS